MYHTLYIETPLSVKSLAVWVWPRGRCNIQCRAVRVRSNAHCIVVVQCVRNDSLSSETISSSITNFLHFLSVPHPAPVGEHSRISSRLHLTLHQTPVVFKRVI